MSTKRSETSTSQRPRSHAIAAAIVAVLAFSTACTPKVNPGDPTTTAPSNSTATTPSATPTPTPTPTPSLPTEADKKAAIASFTKANEIIDDAFIARAEKLPKTLEQYVDPASPFYKEQERLLSESKVVGWHITSRSKVSESQATGRPDMTIDLFTCIDGTDVVINYPGIGARPGGLLAGHLVMKRVGDNWRVVGSGNPALKEVKSCADGK